MTNLGISHCDFFEVLGATNLEDEAASAGVLGDRASSLQISGKGLKSISIALPWSEPTISNSAVVTKIILVI